MEKAAFNMQKRYCPCFYRSVHRTELLGNFWLSSVGAGSESGWGWSKKCFPSASLPQEPRALPKAQPLSPQQHSASGHIMAEELCYLFTLLFFSPAHGMDVQSLVLQSKLQPFVPGSMFHREILQGWLGINRRRFYRDFSRSKWEKDIQSV